MIRLSAIIPAWNCATFLGEAIDSALAQEDAAVEVIVVDDGSTDDTPALLESYGDRIRVLRQENKGLPAARNAGIGVARGDLIGFLDADDTWEKAKSRRQIEYLDAHPEFGLVFSDVWRIDESGRRVARILGAAGESIPTGRCLERLFLGNFILVPSVVVRKSVLDRAGPFDVNLRSIEDYDMWLRIAAISGIGFLPDALASWRDRTGQMSGNRERMIEFEALVLGLALEREPGLRRSLGQRVNRRFARLYDEEGWRDLDGGRLRSAKRRFLRALRYDPLWQRPYLHLVATGFAAVGLRRPRSEGSNE